MSVLYTDSYTVYRAQRNPWQLAQPRISALASSTRRLGDGLQLYWFRQCRWRGLDQSSTYTASCGTKNGDPGADVSKNALGTATTSGSPRGDFRSCEARSEAEHDADSPIAIAIIRLALRAGALVGAGVGAGGPSIGGAPSCCERSAPSCCERSGPSIVGAPS